jgi:hypothetical protein
MNIFKIHLLFIFILSFKLKGEAQILHVNPNQEIEHIFSSASYFNPVFVTRNKIKSITVSVAIKHDLKPIKQTPLFHQYHFNEQGVLIKQLQTYYKLYNEIDTILILYNYTPEGKLASEIRKDAKGYFKSSYTYNPNHTLATYMYSKSDGFPDGKNEIIIYKETFEHPVSTDSIVKRIVVNDIGKAYKEEGYQKNELGTTVYKYNYLINSKIGKEQRYFFNDFGRVIQLQTILLPNTGNTETSTYTYDPIGNLNTESIHKNGIKTLQNEFLYDKRYLLDAQLSKDETTGTITIYKFEYTF